MMKLFVGQLVLCCFMALGPYTSAEGTNNGAPKRKPPTARITAEVTSVEDLITKKLKVESPGDYLLSKTFRERFGEYGPAAPDLPEFYDHFFSEISADTIMRIMRRLQKSQYANVIVRGQAGVGKSFLTNQLVSMLSLGVMPDYLAQKLNLVSPDSPAHVYMEEFLTKTNFVNLDLTLLSRSSAGRTDPPTTTEVRIVNTLNALLNAATNEFRATGVRTVFVIGEAMNLGSEVFAALKEPLDRSGLKLGKEAKMDPDSGYHVIAYITPGDFPKLVRADHQIERRFGIVDLMEPDLDSIKILLRKVAREEGERFGISVDTAATDYLIYMKDFLHWPPRAAPGGLVEAMSELVGWKTQHSGADPRRITRQDAQAFIMGRARLTDLWFPGPNGEPPFHDLGERVKKLVVGHEVVIDKIASRIKAWVRLGMGREVPVFFLGGPTGSGKDTIVMAFNQVMYGHTGRDFMFGIGGMQGFALDAILSGPPLGNHSDNVPGLLQQAFDNIGTGKSIITFNEALDTDASEMVKLKTFLEDAVLRPKGLDTRLRPIMSPIFILGQFGETLFEEGNLESQMAAYEKLRTADIETYFRERFQQAIIDRAKKTGGLYIIPPTPPRDYQEIISIWQGTQVKGLEALGFEVIIDPSVGDLAAKLAVNSGQMTRGLAALYSDLTEGAISAAIDQGLARADVGVMLKAGVDSTGNRDLIIVHDFGNGSDYSLDALGLIRMQGCETQFASHHL